mgnify:CR=1 FL=1
MPLVTLDRVSLTFGHQPLLTEATLRVGRGERVCVVGRNGTGKSTLLRLMICLIRPDGGSVRFEGTEFSADDVLRLRHRIGYVIQDGGLFPHLSAADNVALLARHLGWDEPQFIHYGLVSIPDTLLKTSTIREGLTAGEYSGWDDPRLATPVQLDDVIEAPAEAEELRQLVAQMIDQLPDKEKLVVELYYQKELIHFITMDKEHFNLSGLHYGQHILQCLIVVIFASHQFMDVWIQQH